jgi:hypothetical protein
MNSPKPPAEAVGYEDAGDALSVVQIATQWHLTPARWAEMDRIVTAVLGALAVDDGPALRAGISALTLLGPVRSASGSATVAAPDELRDQFDSLIGVLVQLSDVSHSQPPEVPVESFPVSVYLRDESIHEEVEAAVEQLLRSAGLSITERDDPVLGSWFRRMRAALSIAARSPVGQEALATAAHAADSRLVLRQDAEVTAILMSNLGPVLASLQPTRDAVVRSGALLIVKVDWTVAVHQLTPRQQLVLDHAPYLVAAPDKILEALGLPQPETLSIPADPS